MIKVYDKKTKDIKYYQDSPTKNFWDRSEIPGRRTANRKPSALAPDPRTENPASWSQMTSTDVGK